MSKEGKLFRTVRLLPHAVKIVSKTESEHSFKSSKDQQDGKVSQHKTENMPDSGNLKEQLDNLKRLYDQLCKKYDQLQGKYGTLENSVELEKKRFFEKVHKEAEEVKKQAEREGYDEGFKRGLTEGKAEAEHKAKEEIVEQVSGLIRILEDCHDAISSSMDSLLKQNTTKLIRLWEKVLKRLLYREVKLDEHALERLLEQVLRRLSDKEKIIIYLHPTEVACLQEKLDQYGDLLRGSRHVEFVADDHVDRGSCMVETNLGIYDARWRTQLERLSEEIDRLLMEGQKENGL